MKMDLRLKVIINYIKEFADKDLEEYKSQPDNVLSGKLMGYASSLKLIKDEIDEDEWKNYGLDFDIDKKYL